MDSRLSHSPLSLDHSIIMAENNTSNSASTVVPQKQQRTLDKWIEPSLPDPVPSYKDRPNLNIPGLGVLTHMAPLGTLPNSKMQKIAKTDTLSRARSKNGGATGSSVSTPMEAMTPDPVPNPNPRRSESRKEDEMEQHQAPITPIENTPTPMDTPLGTPLPVAARAPSSHLEANVVSGPSFTNPIPQRTPSQPPYTSLPKLPLSAPRLTFSSTSMLPKPPIRLEAVVLSAIRSARGAGRTHTAFALTDLITNHRHDPNVERVLRAVASSGGNISPGLLSEFSVMVQQKKRESRRKSFTERRESSSTFAGIRFATPSYNSPSKKVAVPVVVIDDDAQPKQQQIAIASQLSPIQHSMSPPPPQDFVHIDKKLKSNDFIEEEATSIDEMAPAPLSFVDSSIPQNQANDRDDNLSEISRASSPLTDLDDLDDIILQGGRFAPTEPTEEEIGLVGQIQARRRSSKRKPAKAGPKLHVSHPNSTNTARSPSPASPLPTNNRAKSQKNVSANVIQKLDPNDEREILRRKARNITLNNGQPFAESSIRGSRTNSTEDESESEGAESSNAIRQIYSGRPSGLRLVLGKIPKGAAADGSDKSSPPFLPFQHELAPASSTNSRQSTPNPFGRPTRKAKSGPRVKSSPMKNRAVPLAGISRASGERNSPVGNGGFGSIQDDNHDDYCSSCGGGGMIVCCDGDGCRRSYHWLCLDPPRREEDVDPTESIYCNSCTSAMRTSNQKMNGLFAPLMKKIERKNPIAFSLSKDISEYFEGVKVGPQGEYEDIVPVNQKHKNRAGYEEAPDYLRLRDSKGNTILCHKCTRSAASGQPIIACSFCTLHWHLDCLDPPLANPPNRERPWRCPCHVDDLLDKIPGMLGPAHKFRRIKKVVAIPVMKSVPNNGHIEIENSPSDDEGKVPGFYNQSLFGKEYRLPERGIKLDFLTRIKRDKMSGTEKSKVMSEEIQSRPESVTNREPLDSRTINEQQAILNLTQLATRAFDFKSLDQTPSLVKALISQAPEGLVTLMAQADATNLERRTLAAADKVSLLAFRTLATSLLRSLDELYGPKEQTNKESEGRVGTAVDNASVEEPNQDGITLAVEDDTDMLL